jgi:hypothetical protein
MQSQIWTLAAAIAASLAIRLPLLLDCQKPYVIAFVGAALGFITIAFGLVRRPALQNVCFLLASGSLCLAIGELGAWFLNTLRPRMITDTLEFDNEDPDLGYSPDPSQCAHVRECIAGRCSSTSLHN